MASFELPIREYENEPSTSKLFRGITEGTINEYKNKNRTSTDNFQQPECPAPVFPFNHVWNTRRHCFELDDTGNGRINLHHAMGSFLEMYPTGEIVLKAAQDLDLIAGACVNIYSQSNGSIDIRGDCKINVAGDCDAEIGGQCHVLSAGNMRLATQGSCDIISSGPMTLGSQSEITINGSVITHQANIINQQGPTKCDPGSIAKNTIDALTAKDEKEAGQGHDEQIPKSDCQASGIDLFNSAVVGSGNSIGDQSWAQIIGTGNSIRTDLTNIFSAGTVDSTLETTPVTADGRQVETNAATSKTKLSVQTDGKGIMDYVYDGLDSVVGGASVKTGTFTAYRITDYEAQMMGYKNADDYAKKNSVKD